MFWRNVYWFFLILILAEFYFTSSILLIYLLLFECILCLYLMVDGKQGMYVISLTALLFTLLQPNPTLNFLQLLLSKKPNPVVYCGAVTSALVFTLTEITENVCVANFIVPCCHMITTCTQTTVAHGWMEKCCFLTDFFIKTTSVCFSLLQTDQEVLLFIRTPHMPNMLLAPITTCVAKSIDL